jgi:2-keto-4-pentenoate hydratase/2-oxohepta-3-ene-1,7-dioic acid hydratase in catechol pathway
MKLLTFFTPEGLSLGVKTDKGVLDITSSIDNLSHNCDVPKTMDQVLQGGDKSISLLRTFAKQVENNNPPPIFLQEDKLIFGPCVPKPGKIIGVGLNYKGYLKHSNTPTPKFPHLFNKYINAIRGHKATIYLPFNSTQVDYEGELVIVIGKQTRNVTKEDASHYILGYCNGNDLSARDLQYSTTSWFPGKCCDGFCPIGPYLVTPDEVGDPNTLALKVYVNGELRQNSNTSDMIFGCSELVSAISQLLTLEPGDIILTGTPEGIVMTYPEAARVWLKEGDVVDVELDRLGRLTNKFAREPGH